MDEETKKILTDEEKVASLTHSEGWGIVRKWLLDLLVENGTVMGIKGTAEEVLQEIGMRQGVVGIIMTWLNRVEGTKVTSRTNTKTFMKAVKDDIILRYDEPEEPTND